MGSRTQHLLAWALVLLLLAQVCGKNLHTYAGPFIAFTHRWDVCPSDGSNVWHFRNTHFNPSRPFEKQRLTGNATITWPFDDTAWLRINMAVRSNNQWKENAFIFDFPRGGCSVLREHIPGFFYSIFGRAAPALLADKKAPCVLPAGKYSFNSVPVSWDFPNFKVMPYGRYRFRIYGGKTRNDKKFCLDVDCETIPKPAR